MITAFILISRWLKISFKSALKLTGPCHTTLFFILPTVSILVLSNIYFTKMKM